MREREKDERERERRGGGDVDLNRTVDVANPVHISSFRSAWHCVWKSPSTLRPNLSAVSPKSSRKHVVRSSRQKNQGADRLCSAGQ